MVLRILGLPILSVVFLLLWFARYALDSVFVLYTANRYGWASADPRSVLQRRGRVRQYRRSDRAFPAASRVGSASGGRWSSALAFQTLGFCARPACAPSGFVRSASP